MESKINKQMCLSSYIKVPLPSGELEELIEKAQDWAIMHGLSIRENTNLRKDSMQFAPFALLPSAFPRLQFQDACQIQTVLNGLIHKVAHDYEFLRETLTPTISVDPFTRKLFDIYQTVYKEGFTQKLSLGLFRSDFMLNTVCGNYNYDESQEKKFDRKSEEKEEEIKAAVEGETGECYDPELRKTKSFCCWKQVEINTIASGMGWLGTVATKFHKFVLHELGMKNLIEYLPENNAIEGLCCGMLEAWRMYNDPRAVILFVVEEFSTNISDQRGHEFEIKRLNPDVKVARRTLKQLTIQAKLGSKKELILNDSTVVAVVYYRYGYSPEHYTEQEWKVRLLIERSLAIKSPSIQYHLAGTKKVQQALAKSGVLEKFFQDEKNVQRVRNIFTAPANVIHAVPKYQVENEPREMFFFREGTIVMWNTTDLECNNILEMLKNYEENSYSTELLQAESEIMYYTHAEPGKRSHLKDGDIYLASESTNLDKYTFSNAISQSVKLGIWESSLDHYIESIEFVTEDLKTGRKIKMTREQVLRKQGELFALRHHINLSSDLLDTPDFYWERDELENLYQQTCGYFAISKRTRVMNEKINHCVELVELLSSHLSDRHHVRLEWMIIVLIMVEVAFELFHYLDRYLEKEELKQSPAQRSTAE